MGTEREKIKGSLLARALAYTDLGWAVFPLAPNTKIPFKGSKGFADASKNPEVIKGWWAANPDANIGVATGAVSGIVVVDVDVKNGSKGIESFSKLSGMSPTLRALTPSVGANGEHGWHDYYIPLGPIRCRTGILPGIDIRGDGGYIVAPGSKIDSKAYEWVDPEAHLSNLPAAIIALISNPPGGNHSCAAPAADSIAKGCRNSQLLSLAGSMRKRGLKADEIAAALKTINNNRCVPPLPESEVESISRSVCNYAPTPANNNESDTDEAHEPAWASDDFIAAAFSDKYYTDWRYTAGWGYWLHWNGRCWCRENTLKIFNLIRATCREVAIKCTKPSTAAKVSSAGTVAGVERLCKSDRRHAATIEQWDSDPWLLNSTNGAVDLRSGALRLSDRMDYMTKTAAAGLGPEMEKPVRWLAFLNDITNGDLELQSYLARMGGYALTGVTSEHAFFFLYGTGANGKSVFLNTLAAILGDYATNAPMDTFMESKSERHPTDLAGLRGARLVTAIEVEKGKRFADAKIKSLTGGDKITARFMRQDFFEYTPQFKLVIAGNDRPSLRDVDEAMKRRLHLIPFTVTIPVEKRDHALAEKLLGERDAILRWAVEGCLQWQRIGLKPPECVMSATDEYLESQDALGRWLSEDCVRNANAETPSDELYQSWKLWGERSGEFTGSMKRFSEDLAKRGFVRSRSSKQRYFKGLALSGAKVQDNFLQSPYFSDEE